MTGTDVRIVWFIGVVIVAYLLFGLYGLTIGVDSRGLGSSDERGCVYANAANARIFLPDAADGDEIDTYNHKTE